VYGLYVYLHHYGFAGLDTIRFFEFFGVLRKWLLQTH
jgi:hypothetical protein